MWSATEPKHEMGTTDVHIDQYLHRNPSDTNITNQRELKRPQNAPNTCHSSPSRKFSSRSNRLTDKCRRVKKIHQYRFKSLRSFHDARKKTVVDIT